MSKFIASDFFKFIPHKFEVEGVEFKLITLTSALVEEVMLCDSYADMLSKAADSGLACEKSRVIDDERLASSVSDFWKDSRVNVDCDPDVKHQVGLKVCEISGLSEFIKEQYEKEQERVMVEGVKEKISTGVPLTDEELDIVKLHDLEIHEDMDKVQSDISAHNNIQ